MRMRNFLLVHSSRSIRAMIANRILADFSDVDIVEAANGMDALDHLLDDSFNLVICNSDLADMPITDLRMEMKGSCAKNKTTEFITLCDAGDEMDRLAKAGFKHIVSLPFDPDVFLAKINQICDPREWRQDERYHIPNSKVILHVWGIETEAKMINVSRGGVLLEVSGDRTEFLLQKKPELTLKIKGPNSDYAIPNLPAKLTRLNAIGWDDNYRPAVMRAAYVFLDLDQSAETELGLVLQMAEEDHLYAEEE